MKIIKNNEGFAMLISIVTMLVFVLILGLSVAKFSVNELAIELESEQSNDALQMAESCVEEAEFRLKRISGYTGGTIMFVSGSCNVSVSGSGTSRTLTAYSTVRNVTRSAIAEVSLDSNASLNVESVSIKDWEEK